MWHMTQANQRFTSMIMSRTWNGWCYIYTCSAILWCGVLLFPPPAAPDWSPELETCSYIAPSPPFIWRDRQMWTHEIEDIKEKRGACDACCEQSEGEREPEHPPHEWRSLHTCALEHNDSLRQRRAPSHPWPFWPQRVQKPVLWRWLNCVFFWSRRVTCLCHRCSARCPSTFPCCAVTHFVCCSQRYWIVWPHEVEWREKNGCLDVINQAINDESLPDS